MRKFIDAKLQNAPKVEAWGTGSPRREFLHVKDLADACLYLLLNYNEAGSVNVGTGQDLSIRELAELIQSVVGYEGLLHFNPDYPDGMPNKLLNVSKLTKLGWTYMVYNNSINIHI